MSMDIGHTPGFSVVQGFSDHLQSRKKEDLNRPTDLFPEPVLVAFPMVHSPEAKEDHLSTEVSNLAVSKTPGGSPIDCVRPNLGLGTTGPSRHLRNSVEHIT